MPRKLYRASDAARCVSVRSRRGVEPEAYRSPWRRDYARIVHSAGFRRLQGKTQVFPNNESDFFRNRLTHSLEVAQIAKSIAIRANSLEPRFSRDPINTDLVELAALAHDLAHPPFGHNGEAALDECMHKHGGFEGNAQTLRILSKLEKRQTRAPSGDEPLIVDEAGNDCRIGLNLTARALASVLKYDEQIPHQDEDRKKPSVMKGYYYTERDVVKFVKKKVLGNRLCGRQFKTVECSIMDIADDIADDIAYATYDLEDAFNGNFLTPLAMIAAPDQVLESIAVKVNSAIAKNQRDLDARKRPTSLRVMY